MPKVMDAMKRDHKFRTTRVILHRRYICSKHNVDERQMEEVPEQASAVGFNKKNQKSENQSDYL
jgi:hypothetical protein